MSRKSRKNIKSYSLIEIIVVINIFALIFGSISIFSLDVLRASQMRRYSVEAQLAMQEQFNAIELNKENLWASIIDNTGEGAKHAAFDSGTYHIVDGTGNIGDITISFRIENTYRDANGLITESSELLDPRTREIILQAEWTDDYGLVGDLGTSYYISNWDTPDWVENDQATFSDGTNVHTTVNEGRIQLDNDLLSIRGNWCDPTILTTTYDIPGTSVKKTINGIPNYAFLGTGGDTSGIAFTKLGISDDIPPQVQVEGEFNGYQVFDIFGTEDYAFLATSHNSKEIVILDISTTPYREVGYFDAPGSTDARSVFIKDNVGYMSQGNVLRTFDVSSKIGPRPALGSLSVGWFFSYISKIQVVNNYAYLSLYNDWYELAIVNVANPRSLTRTGSAEVNFEQVSDIHVSSDGNRVYFGTTESRFSHEFFIVDTSIKTGERPIVGSADTNGMTVTGITVSGTKAILVGVGSEEYQVLDLTDERHPVRCGGLQINSGVNDVASVTDENNNAWAYVLTDNPNGEFMLVLGGESGGTPGITYYESGEYHSNVFDTGNTNSYIYSLQWKQEVPEGASVKLQLRAGDSPDLSNENWVGPDGTSTSYFTQPTGERIPAVLQNNRYIQYRIVLTSDQINTPLVTEVRINYQNV